MTQYYDEQGNPLTIDPSRVTKAPPGGVFFDKEGNPITIDDPSRLSTKPPGWRMPTFSEGATDLWEQTVPPTTHGIFDPPMPGELNPTAQRLQDWINRKGAGLERRLPEFAQPLVDPVLPKTPAEAAVTGVGAVGTGLGAFLSPETLGVSIPVARALTSGAQLATAGVGGALEAQPGHRMQMAEDEMIKTALGALLAHSLRIPYITAGLGKFVAPLAHVFAPAVGRAGVPLLVSKGPEAVKGALERFSPAPEVIEGSGGGEEK